MIKSNVKTLMKEKGHTLRSLVPISGVAYATINKARTDAGISECRLSTLKRIADALDVPLKDLFDGEYQPSKENEPPSL